MSQVFSLVLTFLGGGTLTGIIGFFVYRNRTKAETEKIRAEARAKIADAEKTKAEAKSLEAQAANTLANATGEIIERFRMLVTDSEARCKERIAELDKRIERLEAENDQLRQDNEMLKRAYIEIAQAVVEDVKDYNLPLQGREYQEFVFQTR